MKKLIVSAAFLATAMSAYASSDMEKRCAALEKRLDAVEKRLDVTDKIAKAVTKQVRGLKPQAGPKNDLSDVAVGDMFDKAEKNYDKAEKKRQKISAENAALENDVNSMMNMDDPFDSYGKVRPVEQKRNDRFKNKWDVKNDYSDLNGFFDEPNNPQNSVQMP
ncbi:MAG: hypothetical protein KBD31_00545 [Proteobacteria bacterium]|nr:hypothetical protein [Pseudomonadota bacterium]